MKKYKYKQNGCLPFLITTFFLFVIVWLSCWVVPQFIHRLMNPPDIPNPEAITISLAELNYVEPKEKIVGSEAEAKPLTETQYVAMTMEVAAYAPLDNKSGMCADDNPNITASGTKPALGTIAVNPSVIPFGTKMYVSSYGWGCATDTGQIIRENSNQIEVFMPTYEDAMEWGRKKNVVVFVEVE